MAPYLGATCIGVVLLCAMFTNATCIKRVLLNIVGHTALGVADWGVVVVDTNFTLLQLTINPADIFNDFVQGDFIARGVGSCFLIILVFLY